MCAAGCRGRRHGWAARRRTKSRTCNPNSPPSKSQSALDKIQKCHRFDADSRGFEMYPRHLDRRIRTALADTRIVFVSGPRQSGKTTLARTIAPDWPFRSLDDLPTLQAARSDPVGFLRPLDRAVIDEVQRVPDLLLALKRAVDEDTRPGRFILTGSANVMTLPHVADSLAGRMETFRLLPLSRAEIITHRPRFLQRIFSGAVAKSVEVLTGTGLVDAILKGGFPEALARANERRRQAWLLSYSESIIQRDVREIASVSKLEEIPRLMRVLAEHSGKLINFSEVGKRVGIDHKTTQRYLGILEQLFMVVRVEPWFTNQLARLSKTPKLYFVDTGLLAAIMGISAAAVATDRTLLRPFLETFVVSEILKQSSWSDEQLRIMHFRDRRQKEVDVVVENERRDVVGVEVKAGATIRSEDFNALRMLQTALGRRFKGGVVLYDGDEILSFGAGLWAAPVACLWS